MIYQRKNSLLRKQGMTLMEVLITVSLVTAISVALYNSLSNGLRVWQRSRQLIIEEDVAIFFDKLNRDLHNSFFNSKIYVFGEFNAFGIPTIVHTPADMYSGMPEDEYVNQPGLVEYRYDPTEDAIVQRQYNYSQAVNKVPGTERVIVSNVDRLKFTYIYITDEGETISDQILEYLPSGVEVEVTFSDNMGQRVMKKYIDIPVGI